MSHAANTNPNDPTTGADGKPLDGAPLTDEAATHRVVNDAEEGSYTDVDLDPNDGEAVGTA